MEQAFYLGKYGDNYNPKDVFLKIVRLQVYSTLDKHRPKKHNYPTQEQNGFSLKGFTARRHILVNMPFMLKIPADDG